MTRFGMFCVKHRIIGTIAWILTLPFFVIFFSIVGFLDGLTEWLTGFATIKRERRGLDS